MEFLRFPLMRTMPGLPLRDATHDNTVHGGGSGYADNQFGECAYVHILNKRNRFQVVFEFVYIVSTPNREQEQVSGSNSLKPKFR